jgi:hypothetical protein
MHDANQLHAQITTPYSLTDDEVRLKQSSCLRRQEQPLPSRNFLMIEDTYSSVASYAVIANCRNIV